MLLLVHHRSVRSVLRIWSLESGLKYRHCDCHGSPSYVGVTTGTGKCEPHRPFFFLNLMIFVQQVNYLLTRSTYKANECEFKFLLGDWVCTIATIGT